MRIENFTADESIFQFVRSRGMTSLAIIGAWYLPARRELDLLFPSGRKYRYSNVPAELARRFADAEVKGRFYNCEIRNRFPCRALDETLAAVA